MTIPFGEIFMILVGIGAVIDFIICLFILYELFCENR